MTCTTGFHVYIGGVLMTTLLLKNARLKDDQELQDIWVEDGWIRKIGKDLKKSGE